MKGHLSNIRALLRWAHEQRLIVEVPRIEMPETTDTTGRPVTAEEIDRMLNAIPKVVGEDDAESWEHLLRGYGGQGCGSTKR